MRKTIFILAILLIALTGTFGQGNQQNDLEYLYRNKPTYQVKISTSLKESDISNSKILAEIPKGSKVMVINSYFRKKWEILYQGKRGWVEENKLSFYEAGIENENEIGLLDSLYRNQPTYFVRNATSLKEHMSHQSATLVNVPGGVKVKVINSLFEDWWEVIYDNRRGNLQKSLLSEHEISQVQIPAPPQTKIPISTPTPTSAQNKIVSQPTYSDAKPKAESYSNMIKYSKRVSKKTSLRENSTSKSKIILRFKAGDKVSVIDDSGQWWSKVIFKERVGWVKKSVLKD